ncbi:hypothetical protein [Planosporangium mesophilum]|uniref:Uncharacterized protein n=1 Tax=Planosporangium mesophilum TaxID=689768 RepID=A0A8J3TCV9_9ACTN|nr:hypothetical protein [Planosporangium mesophilum]GII24835.1 hypothetical protein Pme01_44320 [Planosporangium mesophilum]
MDVESAAARGAVRTRHRPREVLGRIRRDDPHVQNRLEYYVDEGDLPDIYAVSAPLAVEAVHRILGGQTRTSGVASAGEIFDAPGFLRALSPHVSVEPRHEFRAPQLT